ncbi:MAG: terminus macrodomain insulation protein YfbV [Pseudomonadota bacterium]
MRRNFLQVLKDGRAYAKEWPHHSVTAAFTESRVIPITRKGEQWAPAIAVLNAVLYYQFMPPAQLAQGMMLSLIMLSLPLQGLYWLGWRAKQPLSPRLRSWYKELQNKLKVSGEHCQPKGLKGPDYHDLAVIIRRALDTLPPHEH